HQLPEERIGRGDQVRECFRRNRVRMSDACGKEPIRDRLGIHVRELFVRQVVDENLLERFHQRPKRSLLHLESKQLLCSFPNPPCKGRKPFRKLLSCPDDLAMSNLERRRPTFPPPR